MATRARLHWLAWGGLLALSVLGVAGAFHVLLGRPASWPPVLIGAAAGVVLGGVAAATPGLSRHGSRVLALSFVVAGMVALVLCSYLVIVAGFSGPPYGTERRVLALSMVAALVSVLLIEPVRQRLVDTARRWSRDERHAPTTALETFGARMTRAVPMDELLLQLAETLRSTIGPAGAEIWTGTDGVLERSVAVPDRASERIVLSAEDASVVARARATGNAWITIWLPGLLAGREDLQLRVAPVAHLGDLLGLIVVARPAEAPAYDDITDGVLADLARQVGLALHNVRLDSALQASLEELQRRNEELQASRARIVAAADESRRTIERNLHDGAQQHLVALAVKLGLARQLLDGSAPTATALLEELRGDVQAAIDELRELAHGIYPPLLRDRGLAEALRAAAARAPLPVTVDVDLPGRFSPEAEAAVYFCVLEAMQNAGKHAGTGATVTVTAGVTDRGLTFTVTDNGAGFDVTTLAGGHGFTNMTDRVGAMGGAVDVESAPGRGTTVTGWLPSLPAEVSPPAPAPATQA